METNADEIFRRLGKIEADLATLLERAAALRNREDECRADLVERITAHEVILRGNGRVGLIAEVMDLQRQSRERALERATLKRWLYSLVGLVAIQLLARIPELIAAIHRLQEVGP